MGKKSKEPQKHSDTKNINDKDASSHLKESNSTNIFSTLFGETTENPLFSSNNPYKRKPKPPIEETAQINGDLENVGSAERAKRKRKDEEKDSLDANAVQKEESLDTQLKNKVNLGNEGKEKKTKKKRKRDEVEAEYEARRFGEVKVEREREDIAVVGVGEKRKKMENAEDMMMTKEGFDDEGKLLRTVFVGNLPLKTKKKALLKEFAKFGEVESVRIRSIPLVDSKVPRKGAIIKKQINEAVDSVHAYIVFKTEEAAHASLAHNMAVVGGNHIRVDRACPPRKKLKADDAPLYDNKRTVFVGNLPFDVKDEDVYRLFCSIKDVEPSIEAVRVIRDPNTSMGKGIAYVLFKTRDAANLVVRKRNLKLQGRELRLSHAKANANATPSKRKNVLGSETNTSPAKKFAVDSRTPGSDNKVKGKIDISSYQGLRASKSSVQKKTSTRVSGAAKFKSKTQVQQKPKERKGKRPAVAARKLAQVGGSTPKHSGTKRKLENRTPGSSGQKKKARKFK